MRLQLSLLSGLVALGLSAGAATEGSCQVPAAAVPPRWLLALRAEHSLESNPRFRSNLGPEDSIERLSASLSRVFRPSRTVITVSAQGTGVVYHELESRSDITYSGSVAASHQASRRTTLRATEGLTSSETTSANSLTQVGLELPLTRVLVSRAQTGLDYAFSGRTTGSVDLSQQYVSFESPDLVGGSTLSASARLEWQRGLSETLALVYQYSHDRPGAQGDDPFPPVDVNALRGTWTKSLGRRVLAGLALGVSHWGSSNAPTPELTPTGGANVSLRLQRHLLGVRFDRTVDQAFGTGRTRTADLFTLDYSGTVFGRLGLSASAARGLSRDPQDPTFEVRTERYTGEVRYSLRRLLDLGAGYTYRRNAPLEQPAVSSRVFRLSLSYRLEWGREEPESGAGLPAGEPDLRE